MARYLTRGMVVLMDESVNESGLLELLVQYAQRTVVVAAKQVAVPGADEVQNVGRGPVTIDAAFRVAADRGIPWVAVPRGHAPASKMLGEALTATGRYASKDMPGYAALFGTPPKGEVRRILAIVDKSDGEPSGLLTLTAVSAAQATGASLDVLLLGKADESIKAPSDHRDALRISRDKDLYEQAVRRARESGISVDWIAAEGVENKTQLVLDMLQEGLYDLVIDDLGSIKLGGRFGRRSRIDRAIAPDAPGAIARAVLESSDVGLVVVLDAVRMGVVPAAVVKGGAGAALAVGLVASATPAAAASPAAAMDTSVSQTVEAYHRALDEALDSSSAADVEQARLEAEQAVAEVEAAASAASINVEVSVPEVSAESADEALVDAGGSGNEKPAPEEIAPRDLAPESITPKKAKKVDASKIKVSSKVDRSDVAKTKTKAGDTSKTLAKSKAAFEKTQKLALKATESVDAAQHEIDAAATSLTEAEAHYVQTAAELDVVLEEASGLSGLLPSSSRDARVAEATEAFEAAVQEVTDATVDAAESLATYEAAATDAAQAQQVLEKASKKVTKADEATKEAAAKASATQVAYEEAVAKARLNPVPGRKITTGFGASGSAWSTGHHTGVDIPAPSGTTVVAAASGTVTRVGWDGAYGNRIVVDHGNGISTTYSHLSGTNVSVGQKVTAGDRIGAVGNTGNSFGAHLHFEVTQGGDGWSGGRFLNPSHWLAGN